jgi:hypothetical protein
VRSLLLVSLAVITACGGDDGAIEDAAPIDTPPAIDATPDAAPFVAPTLLSETGLYTDVSRQTITPGVIEFAPRWQLWSDDAAKRRWIWLPPGTQIDTSDMNYWVFPEGTKLWKEFARGGTRIETRLMQKIGPGNTWSDWFFVSFQWNPGFADATAVPDGVIDEAGPNDIPARSDCRKCHSDTRIPSVVIGFSALQLDFDSPSYDLQQLVTDDRLTAPPTGAGLPGQPFFPLPAGEDLAREAFGYMHANCGGCHNARSEVLDTTPMVLRQDVAVPASWVTTAPYMTTVNVVGATSSPGVTHVVTPGSPVESAIFHRTTITTGQKMPPVGRETVDPTGTGAIRDWIVSLAPPTD